MRSRELDELLRLADEIDAVKARLHRAERFAEEARHGREVAERAPAVAAAAESVRGELVPVLRGLEEQWVGQSPLVAAWQRAADLLQQAESAGGDAADLRAEADAARHRVQAARLATRDHVERLEAARAALAAAGAEAPFDAPEPPDAVADDRPEAARRYGLALAEWAEAIERAAGDAGEAAGRAVAEAEAGLAEVGDPAELSARLAELESALPDAVELPRDAAPSAARRLARAGVQVAAR